MNGVKNDLPMATRDAIESREIIIADTSNYGDRIDALETKFRTLQTRCNNVLARQSQLDALLNELKIKTQKGMKKNERSNKPGGKS